MENRNANTKNSTENKHPNQYTSSTNSTEDHKHANQYTHGADDKGSKNATNGTNAKNCR